MSAASVMAPLLAPPTLRQHTYNVGMRQQRFVQHGVVSGLAARPQQPTHVVTNVQLKLNGSADVRRFSHVRVHNATVYNNATGLPQEGGLMDAHLGAEGDVMCKTCLNGPRSGLCVGHHGHMDLQELVLHPQFHQDIQKLLTCCCFACGTFLLKPEHRPLLEHQTFAAKLRIAASKCSRRAFCPNPECCLPTQPKFRCDTRLSISATWDMKKKVPKETKLTAARLRKLMEEGGPEAVQAEKERQRLIRRQAQLFWDAEEKRQHAKAAKELNNLTIRRVLHMALSHTGPHSMRETLGLAPTLTADALVIDALCVNSKLVRPTRPHKRVTHDLTTRLRFVMAPSDNLVKLQRVREALQKKQISVIEARRLIKDTSNTPIHKVLDRLEQFNREDVHTQVVNLFDDTIELKLQRTERGGTKSAVSGIKAFLEGKTKIVRAATRGGRVELSGRAALGPTPVSWPVDVAGVPLWMATTLSRPETVTRFNVDMLRQCIRTGWHTANGANVVVNPAGEAVKLKKLNQQQRFELSNEIGMGWVVHRCLRDGDQITVNRPPTLWCMNIMTFKVRVVETFALQLCHLLANHFNFDYDGDAVIVHAVQTDAARACQDLMSPLRYVINPTNGFPIMIPTLNTPMGIYLLTDGAMRVGPTLKERLLSQAAYFFSEAELRARLGKPRYHDTRGGPLWTGRQILSVILPDDLFFGSRASLGAERRNAGDRELDAENDVVVVEAGRIICGQWHGKRMFSGPKTITQVIERDFGCEAAARFLNATMAVGTCFLEARGFSLATDDFLQTTEMVDVTRELRRRVRRAMVEVEALPGSTMQRESNRKRVANQFVAQSTALVQAFRRDGDMLLAMTESGAKGSDRHVAQMRFGLGQQLADGRRIEVGPDGTMRASLPCFDRRDTSADTRGFIGHGFGSVDVQAFRDAEGRVLGGGRCGLNPAEMYMLSAASKVAMAAKSINVPKSGALQNALSHGGQFATVRGNLPPRLVFSDRPSAVHTGTAEPPPTSVAAQQQRSVSPRDQPRPVRSMHRVLQFSFGGNALEVTKTHLVDLRWLRSTNDELLTRFRHEVGEAPAVAASVAQWHATVVQFRTLLQGATNAFHLRNFDGGVQTTYPLAVSMEREVLRLWHHTTTTSGTVPVCWRDAAEAAAHAHAVAALASRLRRTYLEPLLRIAQGNGRGGTDTDAALTTFQMLPHVCDMLWHLRPWKLVGVDGAFLDARVAAWLRQIETSLVDDGTAAGTQAVYAMGAATTQAELDKFHHVGEEEEASINMLQRTMELASARATAPESQRTTLALTPDVTRAQGEQWLRQFLFLRLDMVLLPHSQGGAQVLRLPEDTALLVPCERRAWDTVWSLYGFAPPSRTRTVLLLRVDRFACARRKVTWKEVVGFVTKTMWRLGDAGSLLHGSLAPSEMGPDTETPLVVATREADDAWSMLVSCMDWTVLEELRAALCIDGPLFDTDDYDPVPGAAEQALVGRLALFLYRGQVMRGVQSIRSAKIETRPWFAFNAETGGVQATPRHFVSIVGCVKPDAVAKLDLQGIVDFAGSTWNDIHVVFKSLGVEAARALWLQEMRDMVQGGVSMSHLELLASIVFSQGCPQSIVLKPHVNRDGFLSTSTAGCTMQVFAEAAISGAKDPLLGSASLFVGQPGTYGTRACDVRPTEEYLDIVRGDALAQLEKLWSAEEADVDIQVPVHQVSGGEDDADVVVEVPRVLQRSSSSSSRSANAEVVVPPPRVRGQHGSGVTSRHAHRRREAEIVVQPPPPSQGAVPSPARVGDAGALLPHGTSEADFQQVAIQTVRVTKHVTPAALLPSDTKEGDFVFTGDRQLATKGCIETKRSQHAVSDVVRRMRGDVVPPALPPATMEDVNSEAALAETYQLFMNGYNLPKGVQQATHRGITGAANARSIRLAATSKRGARVTLRSTADFDTQYGRSKAYLTTARERRTLAQLSKSALVNMTADQRRAYLKEQKRRSNVKTAAAARRRRDMVKANLVGRGIAFQWHPQSPRRIGKTPTSSTPDGVSRVRQAQRQAHQVQRQAHQVQRQAHQVQEDAARTPAGAATQRCFEHCDTPAARPVPEDDTAAAQTAKTVQSTPAAASTVVVTAGTSNTAHSAPVRRVVKKVRLY